MHHQKIKRMKGLDQHHIKSIVILTQFLNRQKEKMISMLLDSITSWAERFTLMTILIDSVNQ